MLGWMHRQLLRAALWAFLGCWLSVAVAQTPCLISQGLAASSYLASSTSDPVNHGPERAFDGDSQTWWNAEAPSAWLEVDLLESYPLWEIILTFKRNGSGSETLEVWISDSPIQADTSMATLVYSVQGSGIDGIGTGISVRGHGAR